MPPRPRNTHARQIEEDTDPTEHLLTTGYKQYLGFGIYQGSRPTNRQSQRHQKCKTTP